MADETMAGTQRLPGGERPATAPPLRSDRASPGVRRYAVRLSLLALAAACTATPPVPPTSGPPVPGPSPTPAASSPTFRPAASATDATASVAALATSPILGEYETVVADNPRSQTEPRYPFPGKYRLVSDTSGVRVYTPNGREIPYELAGVDPE